MKRMELFANRSVEKEMFEILEKNIPNFYYTLIPELHGKGKSKYRLGTPVWPELNFMLISYLEDDDAEAALEAIREVKKRFPQEGIKVFFMEAGLNIE